MTENQERAEQARSAYYITGGNVQILPNATTAVQIIYGDDGTVTRTERCITPAASGHPGAPSPPKREVSSSSEQQTPPTLALFIPDEATRLIYEARLCACPDTVVLCQTVLTDLFNDILTDYSSPRKLIKSSAFINALLPHLTFKNGANVASIRYGIRKYVLGEK